MTFDSWSFLNYIDEMIEKRVLGKIIEEKIREKGYEGSSSNIRSYISNYKRNFNEISNLQNNKIYLNRNDIVKLFFYSKNQVKEINKQQFDVLLNEYPIIKKVYDIAWSFKELFFKKDSSELENWITSAVYSGIDELKSFAEGVKRDLDSVKNAINLPYILQTS